MILKYLLERRKLKLANKLQKYKIEFEKAPTFELLDKTIIIKDGISALDIVLKFICYVF